MASKKPVGDMAKMPQDKYTQRGRVAIVRGDPPPTYVPPAPKVKRGYK